MPCMKFYLRRYHTFVRKYFRTFESTFVQRCMYSSTKVLSYESTRTSALPYKHLRRYLVLSYSIIYDSTFVLSKVMM